MLPSVWIFDCLLTAQIDWQTARTGGLSSDRTTLTSWKIQQLVSEVDSAVTSGDYSITPRSGVQKQSGEDEDQGTDGWVYCIWRGCPLSTGEGPGVGPLSRKFLNFLLGWISYTVRIKVLCEYYNNDMSAFNCLLVYLLLFLIKCYNLLCNVTFWEFFKVHWTWFVEKFTPRKPSRGSGLIRKKCHHT